MSKKHKKLKDGDAELTYMIKVRDSILLDLKEVEQVILYIQKQQMKERVENANKE